jgi:hypothetical protein
MTVNWDSNAMGLKLLGRARHHTRVFGRKPEDISGALPRRRYAPPGWGEGHPYQAGLGRTRSYSTAPEFHNKATKAQRHGKDMPHACVAARPLATCHFYLCQRTNRTGILAGEGKIVSSSLPLFSRLMTISVSLICYTTAVLHRPMPGKKFETANVKQY